MVIAEQRPDFKALSIRAAKEAVHLFFLPVRTVWSFLWNFERSPISNASFDTDTVARAANEELANRVAALEQKIKELTAAQKNADFTAKIVSVEREIQKLKAVPGPFTTRKGTYAPQPERIIALGPSPKPSPGTFHVATHKVKKPNSLRVSDVALTQVEAANKVAKIPAAAKPSSRDTPVGKPSKWRK